MGLHSSDLIPAIECHSAADVMALARRISQRRAAQLAPVRHAFDATARQVRFKPALLIAQSAVVQPGPVPFARPVIFAAPMHGVFRLGRLALRVRVRGHLGGDGPVSGIANPSAEFIFREVSHHSGISVTEIKGKTRTSHVVRARHIAVWLMSRLTHHSLPQMAARLGGRDHTTMLHSLAKINAIRAENDGFREMTDNLLASIARNWAVRR